MRRKVFENVTLFDSTRKDYWVLKRSRLEIASSLRASQ